MTEEALDGMFHLPEVVQRQIRLCTSPADNQLLRSKFYYEQVRSEAHVVTHVTFPNLIEDKGFRYLDGEFTPCSRDQVRFILIK